MQDSNPGNTFEEQMALAASGQWPLLEVINAAQQFSNNGQLERAISLYRQWLINPASPMAYTVYFNLAVTLTLAQRETEAEQIYRQAIKEKPDFAQAYLNLSALLGRLGRADEAIHILRTSGIPALIEEAERRAQSPRAPSTPVTGNVASVLSQSAAATANKPKATGKSSNPATLPRVSILIPTHNRPDYFEIALKSALEQSYENLEVVISDNSDDELTRERITPYLTDKRIKYHREPGLTALNNFAKCLELASGEFVNFLMDDDIFHPDKISRMMNYFIKQPTVGLVTSFRQLIDEDGNFLPPANPTEQLFPKDTLIPGPDFGEFILKNGRNVLGEPTTVLARREDIGTQFGIYFGQQFVVLADVATWLSVLAKKDCVYIADALSYFRIHSGQDQKNSNMKVRATVDWFRLFMLSHRNGVFLKDRAAFHEMLAYKLNALTNYVTNNHADLRSEIYNQKEIQQLIADATEELLTP